MLIGLELISTFYLLKEGDTMPTTSLWPICASAKGTKGTIAQVLEYVENEKKTADMIKESETGSIEVISGEDPAIITVGSVIRYVSDKNAGLRYVTGINCMPESAIKKMVYTRKMFGEKGRRVLWHGYQSFAPGESNPDQVHRMGVELAEKLWGDRFEIVVATHLDRQHLHNHLVINATSFIDGKKFNWDKEYPRMQKMSDLIAIREGLSTVADKEDEILSNGNINNGRYTLERIVKEDIDSCIMVAGSMEEWIGLMQAKGYMIDDSRKYLRIYPYGHKRCIRVDRRFGEEYTLEAIERRILEHDTLVDAENTEGKNTEDELDEEMTSLYQILKDDSKDSSEDDLGYNPEDDIEGNHSIGFKVSQSKTGTVAMIDKHDRSAGPEGIQIIYIRFIVEMGGYYKRHGRIARTHFLLREELTKLDKYIDESRYLIRNNITTSEELETMHDNEKEILDTLSENRNNLRNRIRRCRPNQRQELQDELDEINLLVKEARKNVKICERIQKRTEDMARRETVVSSINESEERNRLLDNIEQSFE